MRKIFPFLFILTIIFTFPVNCRALGVSAYSAILTEAETDRILYEKNSEERLPMASTTKIMTALCAIENGDLDKRIRVDDSAVGVEGSSIYLKKGEHLTLRELVYGLMLSSGNDAAVAIACAVSKNVDDFAVLMNETAQKIGALNTHFMNPNGLDDENHYTTAKDLAKIAAYAMKNEEFKKIVSTYRTTISYEGQSYDRQLKNHNKLLKLYDGCIGVKTGFTKKSGRCLVSAAERDGVTLVAVTLKAPDDWNDHMNMLNFGFEKVKSVSVIKKNEYLKTVTVKNGMKESVAAVSDTDAYISSINGENNKISLKYKIKDTLKAPVGYRENIGSVKIYLNGKYVKSVPAVTCEQIVEDTRKTFKRSISLIAGYFTEST